jgi:hypothetical protein
MTVTTGVTLEEMGENAPSPCPNIFFYLITDFLAIELKRDN